jgi:anaerobic magnesium-protoporphyrin IX monomethyl ester cyclase
MAKIIFIIPDIQGRFGKPATPHVGISFLAAYIRQKGHQPVIIDLRVEPYSLDALRKRVLSENPDFIGVTSVSLEYKKTYHLINTISSWGIPVIYGGPHVSTVKRDIYQGCRPYAAVYGEGEEKLCDILDGKPLDSIQGIIYADKNGEVIVTPPRKNIKDLDGLPFPAYDLSKLELYEEKKIPLTTSRDCPHGCTYCNVKLVMGRGFRKRSPENVLAEIEFWHARGYRLFGINDDTFTSDVKRAVRICELLIERELGITWELRTGIRVDTISEELLQLMKRAGCHFLAYGIESIDESVLQNVKKGITYSQIERAVTLSEKLGMPFSGFFMIGLPGDSFEKFQELYAFARTHAFNEVRFYNLMPYPNTEVFDWMKEHGRFIEEPEQYLNDSCRLQKDPVCETPEFSRQERIRAYEMGESLMVQLILKKTFGKAIGSLVSPLCDIGVLRRFMLFIGFRYTKFFRVLQRFQEYVSHASETK